MYSIILNSKNEPLGFQSFHDKFLQVCDEHKKDKRALIFAFILYDFENASLNKVLKDEEYWQSLNAISGNYITVFSLHHRPKVSAFRQRNRGFDPGMASSANDILKYNPSKSSNKLIERYFGENVKVKYPAVMFFQVADGNVFDNVLIELDEVRIEESFIELQRYIARAVNVLKGVSNQYKSNDKEIFELVKNEVLGIKTMIKIKKTLKTATSAVELGSSLMGFVS